MSRLVLIAVACFFLIACGEDAPEQSTSQGVKPVQETADQKTPVEQNMPNVKSAGGVTVTLLPETPTSSDCLRVVVQGTPGRSAIIWKVNGEVVASGTGTQLCGDKFKRDDLVTVEVGTNDQGAQASVSIDNSPPKVVDISSTPDQIFAGVDISVFPVAEDADGDDVEFYYQWLINGEPDSSLNEATLPGTKFKKGDTVQVQITPNDFLSDGPVYESYAQPIPNAPPVIISQPPQGITSLDYRYKVEVSDPDDSEFVFRLDEAPEGMTINQSTGIIEWSLEGVSPGEYTIAIIAADPEGVEGAQEYKLTLGAPQ
ncbi:MAG: Ig domain-containing protein [Desulfuromonadales bacterium]|nr:Ig domain-containing protein [Desulfuromonadales bacterium]